MKSSWWIPAPAITARTSPFNLQQTPIKSGHFAPFTEILIEQTGFLAPAAATRDLPLVTRSISEYNLIRDGRGATLPETNFSLSPLTAFSLAHDPFGPRTRMTDSLGGSMAHFNHGNTLTQTNISTGTVTYFTWDYQNRLTEVKVETSTGTVLSDEKFTYDVFGNRIGVSLNGTQTLYTVYDGSNPYMDFNGSGTLTERYLTNPNALSQFYGQVSAGGTVQWFLTDNINSIREVVDSSGNSLDAIAYDPWGTILSQSNAANAPRFLYTGGAYDPITGMYTNGARELNPADGRWMSQDPLGFAAGAFNLYGYVYINPLKMIDPLCRSKRII